MVIYQYAFNTSTIVLITSKPSLVSGARTANTPITIMKNLL